ncbi:MAG: cupin domain-containing protein [Pseudomonadota bacterium]|nr:cupin domain-containing protein [Pseudomonadota bacterium]
MNDTQTAPQVRPIRRIVTVEGSDGRSRIEEDGASPHVMAIHGIPTHAVTELWATTSAPAQPDLADPSKVPVQLAPPTNGTVFRVVEFPPDADWLGQVDAGAAFGSMGSSGADAIAATEDKPHPLMHKTQSVDYAIVMQGEIWAVLDDAETLMKPGDVLVQRATNHAWSNRSDKACLIAFVLVDANG